MTCWSLSSCKSRSTTYSAKQDTLVSGTTLKTVNGSSLLGAGDLSIAGAGASLPVVQTFTGAKALGLADINTYNVSQDATAQVVTLPAQATVSWTADAEIHIERGAAGAQLPWLALPECRLTGLSRAHSHSARNILVTLKRKGRTCGRFLVTHRDPRNYGWRATHTSNTRTYRPSVGRRNIPSAL